MWVHLGACPPWAGDANDATVSIRETMLATTVVARIISISKRIAKFINQLRSLQFENLIRLLKAN